MPTDRIAAARRAFRTLHASGCFVMPNPWDPGSARYLQHLGFPALATTSAGIAFAQGRPDSEAGIGRADMLAHIAAIVGVSDVPVNADFAAGYGDTSAEVADSVTRCVATGVAGLSVEDATGDPARPLFPIDDAVARVRAARAAIDAAGGDVLLTARAECYLVSPGDAFAESRRRLQAYAAAGADVLYAPGVSTAEEIRALVEASAPKPFNLLIGRDVPWSVADVAALGVRRISVGGALARAAWTGFMHAARQLKDGSFAGLAGLASYAEINGFLTSDLRAREPLPEADSSGQPTSSRRK